MATHAKPQQWKKEKSERLRGDGDEIMFIDLRFERWQVVGFKKERRRQDVAYIACSWGDFWIEFVG